MTLCKRSILYLGRKRLRTCLVGLLVFSLAVFVLIGFFMKNATEAELDHLRQSMGSGFTLRADTDNKMYYKDSGTSYGSLVYAGPKIKERLIKQVLKVGGVTTYNIDDLGHFVWANLTLRPSMWALSEPSEAASEDQLEIFRQETKALACEDGKNMINFRNGALTISEGRNIQKGDCFKAVISEWLANENKLSVGDTFTVMTKEGYFQPSDTPNKTWGKPVELEVIGVFHMNFTQEASEYTAESQLAENILYVDMETNAALNQNLPDRYRYSEEDGYLKVTFFVKDPQMLDDIMQQVEAMEEADGLLLSADDTAYKATAKPYKQLHTFSLLLLMTGIGGFGIILYLLMRIWIQGRTREAGILLAIGIGKRKIIGQMLMELFMVDVTILLFTILLSGGLVDTCTKVAEKVTSPKEGVEAYQPEVLYSGELVVTKTSSEKVELGHQVDIETIVFMSVFVCGISTVSVLLASTKITDIEPKKLLRTM